MKNINILKITTIILLLMEILLSQNTQMTNINIDSKENGLIITMALDSSLSTKSITGWQAKSGWCYLTLYQVSGDTSALMPHHLPKGIKKFQIIKSKESMQIGVKVVEPILSFDFDHDTNSNQITATMKYSNDYTANLKTVKSMELNNQNELMMNNIINWLYITGSGLTVTGIIKNHDEINLQTKVGISILTIALIIDKLFL
jgi:hypothetical protein